MYPLELRGNNESDEDTASGENVSDSMNELSELIKKVKSTCQTFGYLTALKYQLRKEFIQGK